MSYLIALGLFVLARLVWWLLFVRAVPIGFDEQTERLFTNETFREWVFARQDVLIFGRDICGFTFLVVCGHVAAIRIRGMAKAMGVGLRELDRASHDSVAAPDGTE